MERSSMLLCQMVTLVGPPVVVEIFVLLRQKVSRAPLEVVEDGTQATLGVNPDDPVEVLPPEVLVELCVVGVDDLEEVGQRFRVRKIGRVDVRVGRRDGRVVGASEHHC